ncbi:hypothetical protein M427DRAFT_183335 [Gonapodya prolifera JEL478]|uniref:CBS domain-containing protein n=1 Tax=Gonapodya prolifera (strain JEL478) TaxID=1344416 RepID=A0A139A1M5_GONPJ|nr:hypothetical protein M427DRAFT_183335 [Gonapodya prolifera JEL478]|eukprot:KXS10263.1 hypothetical protein M427DRAFT_183335 [Gonapodya prolifera JEL478]
MNSNNAKSLKGLTIAGGCWRECAFHKPAIISVPPTTPIADAMKTMAKANVTSLAIQSHSNPAKIVSVVTSMDFMHFLLKKEAGKGPDGEGVKAALADSVEQAETLDNDTESYRTVEFDVMDTLEPVIRSFSLRIHRAIVTDATHRMSPFMLTQTDLIKYAAAHPDLYTSLVDPAATVSSLFLSTDAIAPPKRPVVFVTQSMTAWEALAVLARENLRAVPVLDMEGGEVVATLGVADLRGITEVVMYRFKMPLLEFLSWNRASHLVPTVGLPSTSFADLLRLMVDSGSHEVWVVHGEDKGSRKVVGVVSHSDVVAVWRGK